MEERKSIFDILGQGFIIFGITVTVFIALGKIVGEAASAISTLFSFGNRGISMETLLQLLILSLLISFIKSLFFTDALIKKMSVVMRAVGMFACMIAMVAAMAYLFGWFPVDSVAAWVGFLISFLVSAGISTGVMFLKEKSDNKKLEEALKQAKR